MYNKKILLIIALTVIAIIYYYNKNNDVLKPITKTSIDLKDIQLKAENSKKALINNSSLKINDKSLYDKYTYQQRVNVKLRCNEYFYNINNGINAQESYIEKYKKLHNGKEPADKQFNAFKKFTNKCDLFYEFQDELNADFLAQEESIPNEQNKQYYKDLLKNQDKEIAIDEAQYNLFNLSERNRHSAKMFLHESGWLTDLNSELNIHGLEYNEAFGLFNTALEIRKCELGIIDCSSDSYAVIISCQFFAETCGIDLISNMMFSLTGFEITFVEKYLAFLRTIQ